MGNMRKLFEYSIRKAKNIRRFVDTYYSYHPDARSVYVMFGLGKGIERFIPKMKDISPKRHMPFSRYGYTINVPIDIYQCNQIPSIRDWEELDDDEEF